MVNTPNFNIPKPVATDNIDQEMYRLQEAWDIVDAALKLISDAVANKAASSHGHSIDQIEGLATALNNKMAANKTFKIGDLVDVIGAADAALNYVLAKNADGKFSFSSAASLLGNHGHSIEQVQGLADALNAKLSKSGGSMSSVLKLAFDYAQLWWGDALTGTGWRIIKDTPEDGGVGSLVFQCSTDRWVAGANMKTALYLGANGEAYAPVINVSTQMRVPNFEVSGGSFNGFLPGNGDGASYGTYNFSLSGWWGMAMRTYDGSINGYYDFRSGTWDVKGGFKVNGNVVPHGGFKASKAEILAGVANKFPDAEAVKAAVSSFVSGNQPYVSNGSGSVGHGLGGKPTKISAYLVCTSANNNWNVGDEIELASMGQPWPGGGHFGFFLWGDATNVNWKVGAQGIVIVDKSGGGNVVAPAANWAIRVRGAL